MPAATTAAVAWTTAVPASADVAALISGVQWARGQTLSYDFPDQAFDYGAYGHSVGGFFAANLQMQTAVRLILEGSAGVAGKATAGTLFRYGSFESVSALRFADAGARNAAVLSIAGADSYDGGNVPTAFAYYPNSGLTGGDVWVGADYAQYRAPVPGTYGWFTYIHEFGHAVGLKHGHTEGGAFGEALSPDRDSMEFSVMTYRSSVQSDTNSLHNEQVGMAQTPMMYDIAALQHLYGANYATNSGATRYTWNPQTGEMSINGVGQGAPGTGAGGSSNRVFLTIWDGGGVDAYDMSNYANAVAIDLNPGAWSITSADQLALLDVSLGVQARGNVFNALQYNGDRRSLIENAIGGSGDDALTGNIVANRLEGRGGADRIDGGAGADVMVGGAGDDVYVVDMTSDSIVELIGEGVDSVEAWASHTLRAHVENLQLMGAADLGGVGNALDNRLIGNAGANTLSGGAGADLIFGGAGADRIDGGPGDDAIDAGEGDDTLLYGAGADSYDGGAGLDTLDFRAAPAFQIYLDGMGASGGGAAGDLFFNIENVLGGAGADIVAGNDAANHIAGGAGADYLAGRAGDDRLEGGAGNDQLDGGDGDDRLAGDQGADMLTGGAGADTFVFHLKASAGGLDRIADFQSGADRIEIDASMFGGRLVAGAGVQFVSGPTPSALGVVGGVFLYDDDSGLLSWDVDGAGSGRAVAFAQLLNLPHLGAADFIVVA